MATVFALLSLVAAGCGDGDPSAGERDYDAESLNAGLTQELALIDAYTQGQRYLKGDLRVIGREFRGHGQEYVDAIAKALRGVGRDEDPEATELDFSEVKTQADFLELVYDMENAALRFYKYASGQLFTAAPRILAAALQAGHAQHIVVLRQGLGVDLTEAAPEAFESGEAPPPEVESRSDREGASADGAPAHPGGSPSPVRDD